MKTINTLLLGAALAALTLTASAQSWLTNGLVAYFPFNGNANDESGNGHNGTVAGATLASNRLQVADSAYYFGGDGDNISIPDSPSLDIINAFTLALWIKGQPGGSVQPRILTKHAGVIDLGLSDTGSSPNIFFNQAGGSVQTPFVMNEWVFVAATYDRQSLLLYTNGAVAAQVSASTPLNVNDLPIGIGRNLQTGVDWFKGFIDDVRIYNRALSAAEVHQLYAAEPPFCSPHRATATATVVNGFVVGATLTDGGCGYTNAPLVLIQGGGGSGAAATAGVSNGVVVAINIINAGSGYTSVPKIEIASPPFVPTLSIRVSKQRVTQNVVLGRNYVLESSTDRITWTTVRPPFMAISETITEEFDVDDTGRFFRIRQVP